MNNLLYIIWELVLHVLLRYNPNRWYLLISNTAIAFLVGTILDHFGLAEHDITMRIVISLLVLMAVDLILRIGHNWAISRYSYF